MIVLEYYELVRKYSGKCLSFYLEVNIFDIIFIFNSFILIGFSFGIYYFGLFVKGL